ncbi:MAG: hypothetical protein AAB425_15575, partial [Bdellovibrionota bacterium]
GGKGPGQLTRAQFVAMGFLPGTGGTKAKRGKMVFESGITIEGCLSPKQPGRTQGLILTFTDCEVRWGSEILFKREWGSFDLACGTRVVSVFGGAADRAKFGLADVSYPDEAPVAKTNFVMEQAGLVELYAEVRKLRESGDTSNRRARLEAIEHKLEAEYSTDWLLRVELCELAEGAESWAQRARARLDRIANQSNLERELIQRGLKLLSTL